MLYKLRLRSQLVLLLVLLLTTVLSATGFYLQWSLQNTLETEIGKRLRGIATIAADLVQDTAIFHLLPGEESSRTSQRLSLIHI